MKVLYIGGTGRTGSTLVDRLLGSTPGWLSTGELAYFWRLGLINGGLCTCGEPMRSCPLWSEALRLVEEDLPVDPSHMTELRRRFWSIHLPLMVSRCETERRLDRMEEYPRVVESLYHSVLEVTGDRVLIDSSKEAHYSVILRERTDLDIYYLHLVRDPRATGYSWTRRRAELGFEGASEMARRGVLKSSLYYSVSNTAADAFWSRSPDRYRLLRYEDFVADPSGTCEQIADFVGEEIDLDGVLIGNKFVADAPHTTWGNPNRFNQSVVEIKPDDEWRSGQSPLRSALLGAINLPVAGRYGYRMNGHPAPVARGLADAAILARNP